LLHESLRDSPYKDAAELLGRVAELQQLRKAVLGENTGEAPELEKIEKEVGAWQARHDTSYTYMSIKAGDSYYLVQEPERRFGEAFMVTPEPAIVPIHPSRKSLEKRVRRAIKTLEADDRQYRVIQNAPSLYDGASAPQGWTVAAPGR